MAKQDSVIDALLKQGLFLDIKNETMNKQSQFNELLEGINVKDNEFNSSPECVDKIIENSWQTWETWRTMPRVLSSTLAREPKLDEVEEENTPTLTF